MLKVLFSIITFCLMAKAHAAGFANGNALIATPIQGQVQVQCNGFNGSGTALYTCRDVVMDPQAYDYFVGPQDARADKVELMAFHEDGSSRSKVNNYDGARGKSRDAFNLWISTLFQKPLLEYGRNTIRYKIFSDNNTPYAQGEFGVVVQRGAARQCPAATYHSTDSNDCNSQYSICQRYFEEYRNCH
ncbi:MAG: hypothetical protein KUL82_14000 [Bdellovibrio sp.]|uniref:hypothetical protein n=1 Tax=Bdellovibrio sp. TaxID=28201 RepID=UPI0039E44800|nr:hypothetical protein [Bdellovibrio sp.]